MDSLRVPETAELAVSGELWAVSTCECLLRAWLWLVWSDSKGMRYRAFLLRRIWEWFGLFLGWFGGSVRWVEGVGGLLCGFGHSRCWWGVKSFLFSSPLRILRSWFFASGTSSFFGSARFFNWVSSCKSCFTRRRFFLSHRESDSNTNCFATSSSQGVDQASENWSYFWQVDGQATSYELASYDCCGTCEQKATVSLDSSHQSTNSSSFKLACHCHSVNLLHSLHSNEYRLIDFSQLPWSIFLGLVASNCLSVNWTCWFPSQSPDYFEQLLQLLLDEAGECEVWGQLGGPRASSGFRSIFASCHPLSRLLFRAS